MSPIWFLFLLLLRAQSGFIAEIRGCQHWTETGLCSGHGRCVIEVNGTLQQIFHGNALQSRCLCDSGWTGISDVINLADRDCFIHIKTIEVLFSFAIVWNVFASIFGLWKLFWAFKRCPRIENDPWHYRKRLCRSSSFQITVCLIAMNALQIIIIPLRINDQVTGTSVVMTFLGALSQSFLFAAVYLTAYSWLVASCKLVHLYKNEESQAEKAFQEFRVLLITFFLGVVFSLILFLIFPFVDRVSTAKQILVIIYTLVLIISCLGFAITIMTFCNTMTRILRADSTRLPSDVQKMREKVIGNLSAFQGFVRNNTFTQCLYLTVIFLWPWLRAEGWSYFVGIAWPITAMFSCYWMHILRFSSPEELKPQTKLQSMEPKSGHKRITRSDHVKKMDIEIQSVAEETDYSPRQLSEPEGHVTFSTHEIGGAIALDTVSLSEEQITSNVEPDPSKEIFNPFADKKDQL